MAFNPRSDVVLEVLDAADPARAAAAARRLDALAAGRAPAGDFAADLARLEARRAPPAPGLADARNRLAPLDGASDRASRAKVEFEATMLNPLVAEMLPKSAGDLYGAGAAGDYWRSMLAEQVSRELAKSGALGLSSRLFATHPLEERAAAHAAARATASAAAQMSANALSASSGADYSNGAILFPGVKRT